MVEQVRWYKPETWDRLDAMTLNDLHWHLNFFHKWLQDYKKNGTA